MPARADDRSCEGSPQQVPAIAGNVDEHGDPAVRLRTRRRHERHPGVDHSGVRGVEVIDTQEQADHARALIRVTYEQAPAITGIEAAKANSLEQAKFAGGPLKLEIVGGSLAATSHFTKAGTRAAANTSPEPFSNIGLSVAEDIGTAGLMWLVLSYPFVALGVVIVLLLLAVWLLPKLVRFIARILRKLFPVTHASHVQQNTHR